MQDYHGCLPTWNRSCHSDFHNDCLFLAQKKLYWYEMLRTKTIAMRFGSGIWNWVFFIKKKKDSHYGNQSTLYPCDSWACQTISTTLILLLAWTCECQRLHIISSMFWQYLYIYIYTHTHIYTLHIYIMAGINVCLWLKSYICVCIYVYTCICICQTWQHVVTYTCMHTNMIG